MTDQTPVSQLSKGPRLYGVVDVLRPDRVAGWVIDRTDAARCATVTVHREGRAVGTVAADRPRKDLERQAVGTGAYGFAFTFDPPLEDGMEFTVTVTARSHDGVELLLQPAAGAARAVSPEARVLGRILAEATGLRADIAALRQEAAAAQAHRTDLQDRLELVQLRLENAILAVDVPRKEVPRWLSGVVMTGAAVAAGSLAAGILSFWWG